MVGGTALEEMNTSAEDTVSLIRHDGEQVSTLSSTSNQLKASFVLYGIITVEG